ncbi:hypothetical protein Tco_0434360 [Tanacetum coccineum]
MAATIITAAPPHLHATTINTTITTPSPPRHAPPSSPPPNHTTTTEEIGYNQLVLDVNQSIIYDESVDVNMAYSSKSGNGFEFVKVLDMAYASSVIRRIGC